MSLRPYISIIIPTHNRAHLLDENLTALARQTFPGKEMEVIVVADSCSDHTPNVLRQWSEQAPYKLKSLSHKAASAALTRNLGVQHARGEILLFLDDDVIAWPDLVAVHAAEQERAEALGESRVALGYSKPVYPPHPTFWQKNARLWWEDTFREMSRRGHLFTFQDFFSGNVSLPVSLFHSVGGFETSMTGRLEDYELGIRLIKYGAHFRFLPDAVGMHYDSTTLELWLQRLQQEGISNVRMGNHHPELKAVLFSNWSVEGEPWGQVREMIRGLAFSRLPSLGPVTAILSLLASMYERLRLRKAWWLLTNLLREYSYWTGVASQLGDEAAFSAWLVDGPPLPAVDHLAAVVDLAMPPSEQNLTDLLPAASQHGLRATWQGIEVFTMTIQPGSEPLRVEHLQARLKQMTRERFVPALAADLVRSTGGDIFQWRAA